MILEADFRKKLRSFTLDVHLSAPEGVFALLGASGSGKSMALKCIAGIETPDEGRISIGNRVLYDSSAGISLPPQKRRVGYMFQDYALFPKMTVRRNVMAGMGRRPDPRQLEQYLERFRIRDIADALPPDLSGGQKQRVAMARLVAQNPDVILLDEPFSAMDSHLRWRLESEMKTFLRESGKPAVFVSHDRDEVYHLADRVCCLDRGRSEVTEAVKEFFRNPKTRTAALLSGCKNIAACTLTTSGDISVPEWGFSFRPAGEIPPGTSFIGIRAHSFSEGSGSIRFRIREHEVLEDLFEWTVTCYCGGASLPLLWKVPKSAMPRLRIPEELGLDPEDIMLLRY